MTVHCLLLVVCNRCLSLCSGWRPDPTDKCVQCVKLASAETRLSPYTDGEAQVNKTPGGWILKYYRSGIKCHGLHNNKTAHLHVVIQHLIQQVESNNFPTCGGGFYKMCFCFVEKEPPLDPKGKGLSRKTVV